MEDHRPHPNANPIPAALLHAEGGLARPSLRDQVLIAMPGITEDPFCRSVIYICAHTHDGAMGVVLNQPMPDIAFADLLDELHLPEANRAPVVHFGGPVETGRGFVLHSTDFQRSDTVRLTPKLSITGTIDILRAIAQGHGPDRAVFALGHASWGPGQLESELQANDWLTVPADPELIFSPDLPGKWDLALARLGVSPMLLASQGGRA